MQQVGKPKPLNVTVGMLGGNEQKNAVAQKYEGSSLSKSYDFSQLGGKEEEDFNDTRGNFYGVVEEDSVQANQQNLLQPLHHVKKLKRKQTTKQGQFQAQKKSQQNPKNDQGEDSLTFDTSMLGDVDFQPENQRSHVLKQKKNQVSKQYTIQMKDSRERLLDDL